MARLTVEEDNHGDLVQSSPRWGDRNEDRKSYLYFKKFKMQFYTMDTVNSDTLLVDTLNGVKMLAVRVVGACLAEVKKAAIRQIQNVNASILDSDVLWVLTVPAIWKQGAKRLMRDASVLGGLITTPNSASLMLALEPEAASMVCMREKGRETLKKGDIYIVADCGGGTIDVTVHEVSDDLGLKVKERIAASGGDWGSTAIDRAFWSMLDEIFGAAEKEASRKCAPRKWHKIEREWELSKCSFRGKIDVFTSIPEGPLTANLESKIETYNDIHETELGIEEDGIFMTAGDFRSLCYPTIDKTMSHIQTTLDRCPQASMLFVVGNFAQSYLLQEAFKAKFSSRMEVVVPSDPGVSVVMGAVVIGNAPQIIEERVASSAYGIAKAVPFIPGVHPESHKVPGETNWRCDNIADWFVEFGEKVPHGMAITRKYFPQMKSQRTVSFKIYEGLAEGILYMTDERARLLGKVRSAKVESEILWKEGFVYLTKLHNDESKRVTFTLLFGHSEIMAKVVDPYGGVKEATIEYRT
ncbi:Heat shock 70 kDa protein 12A [Phlyctochytrium planicorne]|nr:Heat shock 70 kDa protein 12A [Phlyctochytrium planicorne]